MTNRIIIVGCGGFGREVHDIIDAINDVEPAWEIVGYADDKPSSENERLVKARGSRVLGTVAQMADEDPSYFVIGIGNGSVRRQIDVTLSSKGWRSATLVHPSATHGYNVRLSAGAIICSGVRLTTNIRIGRHVHIDNNATVGHDTTLGDFTRLNPQACISGNVNIGEESMIGANAAILENLTVGSRSIVGAGALVTKSVPDGAVVKGVPAK